MRKTTVLLVLILLTIISFVFFMQRRHTFEFCVRDARCEVMQYSAHDGIHEYVIKIRQDTFRAHVEEKLRYRYFTVDLCTKYTIKNQGVFTVPNTFKKRIKELDTIEIYYIFVKQMGDKKIEITKIN